MKEEPVTPVSIVVLTYNSMQTLPRCLETLLPTLREEDEVILVDNASRDGTPSYLRDLEATDTRLHMYYNATNLGYSAGCNLGMRSACNDFVVLLNPDTVLRGNWLSAMQAHF